MLLFILFSYIKSFLYDNSDSDDFFSFNTHNKKEVTLTNPIQYIKNKKTYNILGQGKKDNEKGQWYYVHFIKNYSLDVQSYINIRSNNELLKNTFILYLTDDQVGKIVNISLIKRIEPSEKYSEDGGSLAKSDFIIVISTSGYKLPINNEDYVIENIKNDNTYILKFVDNKLNGDDFLEKKKKIVRFLSEIAEIKSISTYIKPKQENAIISGFTQRNSYDFQYSNSSDFYFLERYLNNKGITGKNQSITILDTPIDFYHTMFHDENVHVKLNTYMPNHRKIIYYRFKGSLSDLKNNIKENEHGTHVAGTAAGKSICSNDEKGISYFNGNAPDSKIIYAGHFEDSGAAEIQSVMKKFNSKISSNSYGTELPLNSYNYEYGLYAYNNPDLIFICSAGNDYSKIGNFSIGDPNGSKNVLTVGSISDFYFDDLVYNVSSKSNPNLWALTKGVLWKDPWYTGSIGFEPGKTDILAINLNDGDQCNSLNQNKLILLYGDDFNWVRNCKTNFSSALIVYKKYIDAIQEILNSKSDIRISQYFIMDKNKKVAQSYYSSTGPANKGILKPDVMAPGTNVISSKSRIHSDSSHGCRNDNERGYVMMSGTSMATPNVAGATALIHEYFLSGKWIDNVTLDGTTTRALLINSCKHPYNSKTPDIVFGHGIIDLSTIIPIENTFGVKITHQIANKNALNLGQKPFVTENGHVISKINVNTKTNKMDLQITLSYLDPMLNMDSPIPITRDLDLIVVSPSKKVFLGDHLHNGDTQHVSTNEKVIINNDELEDGEYTIHVYGSNFIDSGILESSKKQEFAVVASGPIQNGFIEFSDSSECPCERCNPNLPGFCLCNQSIEMGSICQAKIDQFYGTESAFFLEPLAIKHIKFSSPKKIKYIYSKSRNPGKDSTIWVSKTCHFNLGEYEVNGLTDETGARTKVNFGTKEVCIAIFNNNYRQANYIIEVYNIPKYELFMVLIGIMVFFILVLFIFLCYLCCCRHKKCCCGCCKCCKKDDLAEIESMSQFSLHERLINN